MACPITYGGHDYAYNESKIHKYAQKYTHKNKRSTTALGV